MALEKKQVFLNELSGPCPQERAATLRILIVGYSVVAEIFGALAYSSVFIFFWSSSNVSSPTPKKFSFLLTDLHNCVQELQQRLEETSLHLLASTSKSYSLALNQLIYIQTRRLRDYLFFVQAELFIPQQTSEPTSSSSGIRASVSRISSSVVAGSAAGAGAAGAGAGAGAGARAGAGGDSSMGLIRRMAHLRFQQLREASNQSNGRPARGRSTASALRLLIQGDLWFSGDNEENTIMHMESEYQETSVNRLSSARNNARTPTPSSSAAEGNETHANSMFEYSTSSFSHWPERLPSDTPKGTSHNEQGQFHSTLHLSDEFISLDDTDFSTTVKWSQGIPGTNSRNGEDNDHALKILSTRAVGTIQSLRENLTLPSISSSSSSSPSASAPSETNRSPTAVIVRIPRGPGPSIVDLLRAAAIDRLTPIEINVDDDISDNSRDEEEVEVDRDQDEDDEDIEDDDEEDEDDDDEEEDEEDEEERDIEDELDHDDEEEEFEINVWN